MRKISWMYRQSGGAVPFHTCGECESCQPVKQRKKGQYRCLAYEKRRKVLEQFRGDNPGTEPAQTPQNALTVFGSVPGIAFWKRSWVACRAFQGHQEAKPAALPEEEQPKQARSSERDQLPGQMNLTDYPGVVPG